METKKQIGINAGRELSLKIAKKLKKAGFELRGTRSIIAIEEVLEDEGIIDEEIEESLSGAPEKIRELLKERRNQLKEIICKIIDSHRDWSIVNNVLSCDEVLDGKQLWYWMGKILIVEKHQQYGSNTKSGDMKILERWEVTKEGTIKLFGRKK